MVDSILNTIKQMLGISSSDTAFDVDIITTINSVFMTLNQLGVGPETVYFLNDSNAIWTDFVTDPTDPAKFSAIKTYIFLKTRLTFDPPSSSYVLTAFEKQIQELEFRLMIQADPPVVG